MQPVGSTDNLPIPEPDGSYMLNQKFVIPIYKKSGNLYLLLVPHFEGFAAHCCLNSNAEAHADIYNKLEYAFDQ